MSRPMYESALAVGLTFIARFSVAAEPPPDSPAASADAPASPPAPENAAPATPAPDTSAPTTARPEQPLPDKLADDAAPVPIATPAEPPAKKGLPRLRIEADRPGVRLLRIDRVMSDEMGEGMLVKTVCTAPCNEVIDGRKRQTFFFGAEGMVPSRGFRLARLDGDIVAHVNGGSIVARQFGFLFGGFGGAAMLGGATMLGVGYSRNGTHLSSEGKVVEGPNTTLTTGGFITLGVGAALVTTAVILVVTAKTKITLVQANEQTAGLSFENGALRF
jgi:hypothetical protein